MATENEDVLSLGANEKVGDYLQRVRKIRGVELEHLAKAIRLSKNIVESIEENRWSDFPTEAYLRSYIISICEKLLIDKREVIKRFSSEINSRFAVSQSNMMGDSEQESKTSNSNVSKIAIAVIVVIALALFISKKVLYSSYEGEPVHEPLNSDIEEPEVQVQDPSHANESGEAFAQETATAAPEVPVPAEPANDTLRLECSHSATDNTCGVSLKGLDPKMYYFTRLANRYVSHNDTMQLTITVPDRTKLFVNGAKTEYGKFNTLFFYNGKIVNKLNRDLR